MTIAIEKHPWQAYNSRALNTPVSKAFDVNNSTQQETIFSRFYFQPNLFSSLGKYCSGQWEHYTVEGFAYVLKMLLATDRAVALDILTRLTSDGDAMFVTDDTIEIVAQHPAGDAGIPDITISAPGKLVLVEAKVNSEVSIEQLHKYYGFLKSTEIKAVKLVLLTRNTPDLKGKLVEQVREVRWDEVQEWLQRMEAKVVNIATRFILDSFISFMKEGGISVQRVDGDYRMLQYSLPQLRNVLDILDRVRKVAGGTSVTMGRVPWGWAGFYRSAKKDCWFGIVFTNPLDFTLEISKASAYDLTKLEASLRSMLPSELKTYKKERMGDLFYLKWSLEDSAFFSKELEAQVKMVQTLVNAGWKALD